MQRVRKPGVIAGVVALALACAGLVPVALAAQKVVTRALGKALVELPDPLSGAADVRELSDGRLLVLDLKDNLLQFVDATLSTMKTVGRAGSGPTEYRRLTQILPRQGDSTLGYDVMNARFLVVDPSGTPVKTISLREAAGGLPVGPMAVRGYDRSGRLFYQGMKITMGPNGPGLSDTSAILRLDPAKKQIDTLGLVRIGVPGMKMSGDMQKGTGGVRLTMPAYPVVDEWALLPDGRLVIVRGADYRLEFVTGPGAVASNGPIPYERVKVTEADKAKQREAKKATVQEITKAAASARAALPAARATPMPSIAVDDPTEWPDYKPAFGQGALKVAPNGEIWIARLRPANNEGALYDVFSREGVLRYRMELPRKTALVGIGTTHLYVVRIDEDELQYLGRYMRP